VARTYVSDVSRKTRGGCELLVFYCLPDVICGVVVLSFERLLFRYGVYTGVGSQFASE